MKEKENENWSDKNIVRTFRALEAIAGFLWRINFIIIIVVVVVVVLCRVVVRCVVSFRYCRFD